MSRDNGEAILVWALGAGMFWILILIGVSLYE